MPPSAENGLVTARRDLGWRADDQGVTVTVRRATAGVGFTRLQLNVAGVGRRKLVAALDGLRVQDADGNDLLPGGEVAHVNTASSDPGPGGTVDADVVLDRAIDPNALARVQLRGLTVAEDVIEHLAGVLVDPELQRNVTEDGGFLRRRPDCRDCRVQVRCQVCTTIRVAGTAYRLDQVLLLLEPTGPTERSALNPSRRRVLAFSRDGGLELSSWIDGADGEPGAVVAFSALELAARSTDAKTGKGRMAFDVEIAAEAEQPLRGHWDITQRGAP
jgi:hypothetical protein